MLRVEIEALDLKNENNNNNNNNTTRRLKKNNKVEIGDYVKWTNKAWHEGTVTKFGTKKYWVFIKTKDGVIKFHNWILRRYMTTK